MLDMKFVRENPDVIDTAMAVAVISWRFLWVGRTLHFGITRRLMMVLDALVSISIGRFTPLTTPSTIRLLLSLRSFVTRT